MAIEVRRVENSDREAWCALYAGYRSFYEEAEDSEAVAASWDWVSTGQHSFVGLVAIPDGELVGFANLRRFARPLAASFGLYLDDLFTASEARGKGAGRALLREASAYAERQGASVVRWITDEKNATARSLYDSLATATAWVTYDMKPAAG